MNNAIEFKNNYLKRTVRNIISIAKKDKKVKPITEAFKDVPTSKENHKGKLNYYSK